MRFQGNTNDFLSGPSRYHAGIGANIDHSVFREQLSGSHEHVLQELLVLGAVHKLALIWTGSRSWSRGTAEKP